jgi:hypothetical protein
MENYSKNFDLYDLIYANYNMEIRSHPINIEINNISSDTKYTVKNCLCECKTLKSNRFNEIKFSDVTCTKFPMFDENNKFMDSNNVPVSIKENKNIDPVENINRFIKFDINKLPLIDVANFLGIKIEKSNNIGTCYGKYIPIENKILLGSDYIPTFVHELVHAIVHFIDMDFFISLYDTEYNEFIAEFTAIVLCKIYKIQFDISYSIHYIEIYRYNLKNGIPDGIMELVEIICEFVKGVKKLLKIRKTAKIGTVTIPVFYKDIFY